ncbi:H+/nucleoside cotransporter [Ascobolus immersus RN42]|uniref:H+/nucleoside cotransporter n=1 Tax=Ascobolus immersus RN42 TaxID=1160509 RepID=A0A3N4IH39_ASCIM|nr:H+/nucleoside cotransporter [Ascobolus immersus RN42]
MSAPSDTIKVDPAFLPANQHHHEHLHHSKAASPRPSHDIVYTHGNTLDDVHVPPASPLSHGGMEKDLKSHDMEKGDGDFSESLDSPPPKRENIAKRFYRSHKWVFHLFIAAVATGWWIASLVLHHDNKPWVVPFLFWLSIVVRMVTFYVPARYVMVPVKFVWVKVSVPFVNLFPEKLRVPLSGLFVFAIFCIGAFASEEAADNNRENRAVSLFGLLVALAGLWFTSAHRDRIQWQPVIVGMLIQFIIALFVLRTGAGFDIFKWISDMARSLLGFASLGTSFLFSEETANLGWFSVNVLPAIIFFIALCQMLFHWGLIQWFIMKFAQFFFWAMGVSGAESVVAAASPFIGQGESAMLIRPFIPHLTLAEIHQVMASGFATIAGSVLVAYIGMGLSPQALISSCVMSIPASLAVSKLRYPETEESLTRGKVIIPDDDEHRATNSLHAFANGAWLGLKIAGMIAASLLCILAFIGLLNGLLGWWGRYLNINDPPLSVEMLLGYVCYPISFLLGVPRTDDLYKVAKLIGLKISANEFVAYNLLQNDPYYADLSPRSRLIATYALCGFANFGSLGTQIGVLGQISPGRSGDVSRLAFSALITGAISTFTSASVAGLILTDQDKFIPAVISAAAR